MIVKYWVAHFVISGTCFRGFAKLWRQEPAAGRSKPRPYDSIRTRGEEGGELEEV
jgi:hypothetical protein